jgi:hypothetical protein
MRRASSRGSPAAASTAEAAEIRSLARVVRRIEDRDAMAPALGPRGERGDAGCARRLEPEVLAPLATQRGILENVSPR